MSTPASTWPRRGGAESDDERDRQEADRQRHGPLREPSPADKQVCPVCQITFLEFRNSGRLGCPYDYEVFRDELMPLLENIHGETRHSGKVPRAGPAEHAATDDPHPVAQRAEAGGGGRGLRGGGPAEGPDQGHRTRAWTMTTASVPGRDSVPGQPAGRPLQVVGPMRCQRCQKEATIHLTEPVKASGASCTCAEPARARRACPCPNRRRTWRWTPWSRA